MRTMFKLAIAAAILAPHGGRNEDFHRNRSRVVEGLFGPPLPKRAPKPPKPGPLQIPEPVLDEMGWPVATTGQNR